MIRKLYAPLLVLLLVLPLSGCPKVIKGGNEVDQALATILLTISNTHRFLELVEQLYAPQSTVHLIDQSTALRLNDAGAQIIKYSGDLYNLMKVAGAAEGKLNLTPRAVADANSYANAMKASLALVGGTGISSAASGPLNALLRPLTQTTDALALRLQTLKATARDTSFEITLTPAQRQQFADLEAAIR